MHAIYRIYLANSDKEPKTAVFCALIQTNAEFHTGRNEEHYVPVMA